MHIQLRRGLRDDWTAANSLLAEGELAVELDTGKYKLGDGIRLWNDLPYSSGSVGPTGPTGEDGADGADGLSAYEIAVNNGFNGTEEEWLVSIKGEQGIPGLELGISNIEPNNTNIWFNTFDARLYVKNGNIWVDASPEVVPYIPTDLSEFTDDFNLLSSTSGPQGPKGDKGDQGPGLDISNTEPVNTNIWFNTTDARLYVKNGNVWVDASPEIVPYIPTDISEFTDDFNLLSSVSGPAGPKGDTGATGLTAYEVAVANGFTGTEAAWLLSIKGTKGDTGPSPWNFVGVYDNGVSYALGDAVTFQGGFYYRTGNPSNPGYPPTPGSINASWTPVADKGDTGATGAKGDTGATGAKGDKGDTGDTGPQGEAPPTYTYPANSISLTDGVYIAGSVTDIQTFNDGLYYNFTDGTHAGPAWQVDINFINVVKFNRILLNIGYTQNSGHTVYVQLFNHVTSIWDSIGSYTGLSGYYQFALEVLDSTNYISNGESQLKLYHNNTGNALHETKIDYAALEQSTQGGQGPKGATGATGATGARGPGVTISETAPLNPGNGDLWWDNSDNGGDLSIFYVDQWVPSNLSGGGDSGGLKQNVTITAATYIATPNDWYIGVNRLGTVSISLPEGTPGQEMIIKDESGACASHPITIIGTIDNDEDGAILSTNNGGIRMLYSAGWRII